MGIIKRTLGNVIEAVISSSPDLFDMPFDKLMVLSNIEGLMVLSIIEGLMALSIIEGLHAHP